MRSLVTAKLVGRWRLLVGRQRTVDGFLDRRHHRRRTLGRSSTESVGLGRYRHPPVALRADPDGWQLLAADSQLRMAADTSLRMGAVS